MCFLRALFLVAMVAILAAAQSESHNDDSTTAGSKGDHSVATSTDHVDEKLLKCV